MSEKGIDTGAQYQEQAYRHDRASRAAGVLMLGDSVEVDHFNDLSGEEQIPFAD
jgi:hypothetical protein